jgi:hypothetical protein
MANTLYNIGGREGFLGASIDWDTDDIRAILVDTGAYTFSQTHDFLDDVAAGSRISTTGTLTGRTIASGIADLDDFVFTSVSGTSCEAIIFYKHTGTESTSRLILYIDTASGLPITPNGQNINVTIDNGTNKLFRL